MTSTIFIISTILGLPALIVSFLSQAEFWQRKEYRTDRVLATFRSPELIYAIRTYIVALIFVISGWVFLSRGNLQTASITGLASLAITLLYYAKRATNQGIFRPRPTTKAMLLLLTTILLTTAYMWLSSFPKLVPALHWATIILLAPIITTLSVYLINLATGWRKHQVINQAKRHRQKLTQLKVVGITGSYGKTSTKHFLSQLIPEAVVSKEHRNSEFPIAQDILEQLKPTSQTYIVEMGAYSQGEIKALSDLAQPHIGIITAIGNQHLATFGSLKKILQTKWELIEALPNNGIAILNADDEQLSNISSPSGRIYYSIKKPADIYVDNINIKAYTISCHLHIKEFISDVTIPLVGTAALSNVMAAVAAAHARGVNPDQIVSRLKNLTPYPSTMEVIITKGGSAVIDDSYSANEQGVLAAIKHLKQFPQPDQRIVLVPLIELGEQAGVVHQRIGGALAKSGATVYVYGTAHQKELISSFKNNDKIHIITQPKDLMKQVTKNLTPQTILLLEGRIPEVVRKSIIS